MTCNVFSWIEIRRGLNIFLNAYLKTIANKYKNIYWQKISLSKYILKHVLVNTFDPFDISYTYIYIYTYTHMCSVLWSPELKQMICTLRSDVPNLIKWFALWSPELNQMICALRSDVPIWTKWFALWSPELNQMICALRSEVPNLIKWFALCALKSRT